MIIGLYATESERLTNRTRGDRLVSETGERKMKREGERESRKRERERERDRRRKYIAYNVVRRYDVVSLARQEESQSGKKNPHESLCHLKTHFDCLIPSLGLEQCPYKPIERQPTPGRGRN